MAGRTDKFKIGLFVVVSLLLAVGVVIWLGASRYFQSAQTVVAYFNESVQGLEQDSPVKFRGVTVGRVSGIRMAPDQKLVEVVMNINENFKLTDDLGIRTSLLGITGQKYLEMDHYKPEQQKRAVKFDFDPEYPVIDSYPSEIREFGDALDNIFQKMKAIDVEQISRHLVTVAAKLDKIMEDPKIDDIGTDAAEAVSQMKQAATKLNTELDRLHAARRIGRTFDRASEALERVEQTTSSADRLIRRTDTNLNRLSQKFERSLDDLNEITRKLKDKPWSYLLWGPKEK